MSTIYCFPEMRMLMITDDTEIINAVRHRRNAIVVHKPLSSLPQNLRWTDAQNDKIPALFCHLPSTVTLAQVIPPIFK